MKDFVPTNDDTLMPFGKHKGKRLGDIPADYLIWLYDQEWFQKFEDIFEYVAKNYQHLEKEAKQQEELFEIGDFDF